MILVWDILTGQIIRRITGLPSNVNGLDISPDGRTILSAGQSSYIILWDAATGLEIRRFRGYENSDIFAPGAAWTARFSPDGHTGQQIRRFVGHADLAFIDFRPDGRTAFSGSVDRTAILWDVATGTILHRFTEHGGSLFSLALSSDGRLAFASSADGASSLWNLQTYQEIRRFIGSNANPVSESFSPDGHLLLVGLQDGNVQLWRIDNRYIPELACDQRLLYRLTTSCDANDLAPTVTPVPSTPLPVMTEVGPTPVR
jgi:hypothetical protein